MYLVPGYPGTLTDWGGKRSGNTGKLIPKVPFDLESEEQEVSVGIPTRVPFLEPPGMCVCIPSQILFKMFTMSVQNGSLKNDLFVIVGRFLIIFITSQNCPNNPSFVFPQHFCSTAKATSGFVGP